jgi:hypothetical protein
MSGNVGARAVSDTGSTTGLATVVLALLSAGTMASISLVGAHQLSLAGPTRLREGGPSAVRAPAIVVVTPHAAATASGTAVATHRHPPKTHQSSPSDITVVPALLTSPTPQQPRATTVHVRKPHVRVPSIAPLPAPTAIVPAPVVTVPATATPTVPTRLPYPKVTPEPVPIAPTQSRTSTAKPATSRVDAYQSSREASTAVLGEKIGRSGRSACDERGSRDHQRGYDGDQQRGYDGDQQRGYDGDRGRQGGSHQDRRGH